MDGDAGNDGVEVNGAATAGDVFTVVPAGARVDFDRTNLVPFSLDISTERLEVNGLGGSDSATASGALAPLILISLSGGTGADTLTGADGPDFIEGGEDNDVLAGGGGDDRIVGDRGGDAMSGGDGDDTLVWNNGDGSDVMNGEGGRDTIEVNGAPTAGDAFTVAPAGARIDFDRTNLVPFSLDIGTTEAMALNGLGGDDTVAVGEVGAFQVTAAGGSGNDTLNGAGGAETLLGGSGNDAITPGGGQDVAAGDEGNDTIAVRDGASDFVRCGDGADSVSADTAKLDVGMAGCEIVKRRKPDQRSQPEGPQRHRRDPADLPRRRAVQLQGHASPDHRRGGPHRLAPCRAPAGPRALRRQGRTPGCRQGQAHRAGGAAGQPPHRQARRPRDRPRERAGRHELTARDARLRAREAALSQRRPPANPPIAPPRPQPEGGAVGRSRPMRSATSAREPTCSFANTFVRWLSTVLSARKSCLAIRRFV